MAIMHSVALSLYSMHELFFFYFKKSLFYYMPSKCLKLVPELDTNKHQLFAFTVIRDFFLTLN